MLRDRRAAGRDRARGRAPDAGESAAGSDAARPRGSRRAIERALSRGGDLAEVYAEERQAFGLTLDDHRVERPQAGFERGASIRVVTGDASWFGHTDGLEGTP